MAPMSGTDRVRTHGPAGSWRTIDAHIHLDKYEGEELDKVLAELGRADGVEAVVAVSVDLASCEANRLLAARHPGRICAAYGFHPEQPIPPEEEMDRLFAWIEANAETATAIGEVGLPYYKQQEAKEKGERFDVEPYVELLDRFAALAVKLDLPMALHCVYDDAPIACDVLEKRGVAKAHFHWYKGDVRTTERIAANGWFISLTPDVLYEPEIRKLAADFPLSQLMTETDGPWPYEGKFSGRMTVPSMTRDVAAEIAAIRGMDTGEAARILFDNAKRIYGMKAAD
jgi:TatD DNase family protein